MMMQHTLKRLAIAALALASPTTAAVAQTGADFFNGKTVNYIVATDAGGGYDVNGRLVAEFMQKHLPGSTFVVRNMPGAGHIVGTNYVNASTPDGLTIGTFNTGLIYSQLVGNRSHQVRSHQDELDRQCRRRSSRVHHDRAIGPRKLRAARQP